MFGKNSPASNPSGIRALSWKADLQASLVVFLVALPLCMGIAIASGVPREKAAAVGILTGIVGALVVGPLGGCVLQVSGPAAGLAVLVGQIIAEQGHASLGLIILVAGFAQILAGIFKLGQWFRAVSPAIIHGMLAGIGMLIVAGQFHVMVDDNPPGTGKEWSGIVNLMTIPEAVWKGLTEPFHQAAAIVGVVTILVILFWSSLPFRRLKVLPAPLVGVMVATLLAMVLQNYGLDPKDIEVPNSITHAISMPTWANLSHLLDKSILVTGLTLAFIASAESLLSASAVDAMQQSAPRTLYDRELAGQGAGNVVCGFLGLLPVTGVIVRSSANVLAGGQSRLSAVIHGIWMAVFILVFPHILRLVPVASLAAILVYTGCKLMNPKVIRELAHFGKGEVVVFLATMATVVIVDLLTGIVLGLALALAKLIHHFIHLRIRLEDDSRPGVTNLRLEGAATFLRLPKLANALEKVPEGTELHVHLEGLNYIDHACLDLLMSWEKQHESTGGSLVIDWEELTANFHKVANKMRPKESRNGPGEIANHGNRSHEALEKTTLGSGPHGV